MNMILLVIVRGESTLLLSLFIKWIIKQLNQQNYQLYMLASVNKSSTRNIGRSTDQSTKILTKNNNKLTPLKLDNPERKSRDFYTFQRSLVSSRALKIPQIPKSPNNHMIQKSPRQRTFRQTFSSTRNQPIASPRNFRNRNNSMINNSNQSSQSRIITSQNKRISEIASPQNKMNNTSDNFRPPTSFRRFGDEDHNNYLSRYEIIKELGKGTYGIVHLAKQKPVNKSPLKLEQKKSIDNDENSDDQEQKPTNKLLESIQTTKSAQSKKQSAEEQAQKLVAIKVYQKFKMNKDPTKFKNIRKEINIMQNIEHQNIIKLYESVDTLTKISLVVEYGGEYSLLDYLKKYYPLSEISMKKITKQILQAIVYLHEKNIVHRDIKLQNILMLDETVKLIDFGFGTLTHHTRKLNAICGTPNYMAPELLSKKQYFGQQADIWSFGVVVFALGEGRHPFKADTYNQLERIVNKGNYTFKKVKDPIFQSFVKRILRLKPEERPKARDLFSHPWLAIKQ